MCPLPDLLLKKDHSFYMQKPARVHFCITFRIKMSGRFTHRRHTASPSTECNDKQQDRFTDGHKGCNTIIGNWEYYYCFTSLVDPTVRKPYHNNVPCRLTFQFFSRPITFTFSKFWFFAPRQWRIRTSKGWHLTKISDF